jgi:hypothetical protein
MGMVIAKSAAANNNVQYRTTTRLPAIRNFRKLSTTYMSREYFCQMNRFRIRT